MLVRSTTLLCLVAVMTAGTAYGEIAAGDFALGMDASLGYIEGVTAIIGSARVSWFAMPQVEVVGRISGQYATGGGDSLGSVEFGVDGNYLITPDSTLIPYVGAHLLGHEIWAGGFSDLGYGFGGQAGCLFALDDHSFIRLEYRATWVNHGSNVIAHQGTVGYMYKW